MASGSIQGIALLAATFTITMAVARAGQGEPKAGSTLDPGTQVSTGFRTDRLSPRKLQAWKTIEQIVFAEDASGRFSHPKLHSLWQWVETSGHVVYLELPDSKDRCDHEAGGMYRIRLEAEGDIRSHVVWRYAQGLPQLASALHYEGVLYTVRMGIVSVFDPANGRLQRQDRFKNALAEYYASPVGADGKIYLTNLEGVASVLKSGVDWTVLGNNDLGEQVSASPAIAGGRIFVRTQGTLYCFGRQTR